MEHVIYYLYSVEFELLGNLFLTELKSIYSRHQKGYATIYQIIENLVLHLLQLILYKD